MTETWVPGISKDQRPQLLETERQQPLREEETKAERRHEPKGKALSGKCITPVNALHLATRGPLVTLTRKVPLGKWVQKQMWVAGLR